MIIDLETDKTLAEVEAHTPPHRGIHDIYFFDDPLFDLNRDETLPVKENIGFIIATEELSINIFGDSFDRDTYYSQARYTDYKQLYPEHKIPRDPRLVRKHNK